METLAEGKEAAPEIESSQLNLAPETGNPTDERFLFNYQATRTVIVPSTTTIFSFAAATIKSTFNLASSAALACLPANYVVC